MIFIPKEGELFYYIEDTGNITNDIRRKFIAHRIKSGNCYCTEEDARKARDRQYAKRELEVLADELNGGVNIDWNNRELKYSFSYCCNAGFSQEGYVAWKDEGTTYSLSPNFLEEALKRLGETKLKLILDIKE